MKYVIDRIEGVTAVCEDEHRNMRNIPLAHLYDGAREGDHFREENGEFFFSEEETDSARRKNVLLQNVLFDDDE